MIRCIYHLANTAWLAALMSVCCVSHVYSEPATVTSNQCASKWSAQFEGESGDPSVSSQQHGTLLLLQGSTVLAVSTQSGKVLWRASLLPDVAIEQAAAGNGRRPPNILPPVIAGDIALIAYTNGFVSRLLALDIRTGKTRWEFDAAAVLSDDSVELSGPIMSPPFLWKDRVIFRTARGLTALSLADGALLWKAPMDTAMRVPLVDSASPVGDRYVFFNSDFGVAYAFDPLTGRNMWRTPTSGAEDRNVLSIRQVHITVAHCQPVLVQGHLLVADGLGNVYSLNSKTGSVQWHVKPGGYTFRLATLGGSIYAGTDQGLFQLDLNTGKTVRVYAGAQKVVRCEIIGDKAILTRYPSGWEVFDFRQWKPIAGDTAFSPVTKVAVAGNLFFLSSDQPSTADKIMTEVRAFSLTLGQKNYENPIASPASLDADAGRSQNRSRTRFAE